MKILYILFHDYERLPIHTVEVVQQMHSQGHQVSMVTALCSRFLRSLHWPKAIRVYRVPIVNVRILRKLIFMFGQILLLPLLLMRERPAVIYERFSQTTLVTAIIGSVFRVPLVVEVNGIVNDEMVLSGQQTLRVRFQSWVERIAFKRAGHIITVTEGIRQWIHSHYGIALERITAISNGTNPQRFLPFDRSLARQTFGVDNGRPVVGYLGSLFPWCGLKLLVEALPQVVEAFPDVLFIVGGGQEELKKDLEEQAQSLHMGDHIRFQGEVSWDQAAQFISAFDLAVAPAQFADRRSGISPQKVYAYLACGRPVIGSDLPGLGDMLEREKVGVSFPEGDAESLGYRIIELLKDRDHLEEMAARAREVVLERYTWEAVVRRTITIIQAMLTA